MKIVRPGHQPPRSVRIRLLCIRNRHHLATMGLTLDPEPDDEAWMELRPAVRASTPEDVDMFTAPIVFLECMRCTGAHDGRVDVARQTSRLIAMADVFGSADTPPTRDVYI